METATLSGFKVRGLVFKPAGTELEWTASLVLEGVRVATINAIKPRQLDIEFTSSLLYRQFIVYAKSRHPTMRALQAVEEEIGILIYAAYTREMAQRASRDAIVFIRDDDPETPYITKLKDPSRRHQALGCVRLAYGPRMALVGRMDRANEPGAALA